MAGFTRLDLVSDGRGKIGLDTVQPVGAVLGLDMAQRVEVSVSRCEVIRNGRRCTAVIGVRDKACAACRAALVAELERLAGSCADGESEG
jgi:hypothetical protein